MAKKATNPVPEGVPTVTVHLFFNGNCHEAVEFYQNALGAQLMGPVMYGPDGKSVMHAMVRIGDSGLMMADAWPGNWEKGPTDGATAGLFLYVEDCDALYHRALDAGCEVVEEMMDAFWGDRMGKVKDPFGHTWAIASNQWILTPEEMEARGEEWMKSMMG